MNEADCKLVKLFERAKKVENNDELVVTKAKKMGKELFAELDPESRKQKLDSFVSLRVSFNVFYPRRCCISLICELPTMMF